MSRWILGAGVVFVVLVLGCSSSQDSDTQTADDMQGESDELGDEPVDESMSYLDQPACQAYENSELDPLQRWISVFPIERGGAVLIFTASTAEPMDVEAVLEMSAIQGYEDFGCGTAVVVWVPGLECQGEQTALATRVEEGTEMHYDEGSSTCFRIDEIRLRISEECEQGNLPADRCP